jgi:hypothetical protein
VKWRYFLAAATVMLCTGLASTGSVRADTVVLGPPSGVSYSVNASNLERSPLGDAEVALGAKDVGAMDGRDARATATQPGDEVINYPEPLPGLLVLLASTLAYLWQRKPVGLSSREPATARSGAPAHRPSQRMVSATGHNSGTASLA